jgi:hypothetical protein
MEFGQLTCVRWENGEGRLMWTVGWVVHRGPRTLLLAYEREVVTPYEMVPHTVEVPIDNIHYEEYIDHRTEV